jgi:D-proline reductase (dithiol) PrdB
MSVGLIAREIEAAGVPTICMTSAWDITEAVIPPRSVYLHYPLGHTSGRPDDPQGQRAIVSAALQVGIGVGRGEIVSLPFRWEGDVGWEERAYTPEHTATGPDGKPVREV